MWDYLQKTDRPIVLYGTGNAANKIIKELEQRNISVSGIFASDGFVRNREFAGFPVISYSQAKEQFPNMIVLLCFGSHLPEVIQLFKNVNREQEMYAPDLAIAGEGLFTRAYAEENKDNIEKTMALLADDKSREVLRNCIEYKCTGKIDYLLECETPDDENWSLLNIGPDEVYVDLGAYQGDTLQQFLSFTDTYEHIYAVEPDNRNFRKLTEYAGEFENCSLIHMAVNDQKAVFSFSKNNGRGGGIGKGTNLIEADSLDHILNGAKATFIKMDLEGQEPAAIKGAEETIRKYRPKMLISAYHRVDDLWALPAQILAIRPDYKVYLRKTPCLPAWEINYYFV